MHAYGPDEEEKDVSKLCTVNKMHCILILEIYRMQCFESRSLHVAGIRVGVTSSWCSVCGVDWIGDASNVKHANGHGLGDDWCDR